MNVQKVLGSPFFIVVGVSLARLVPRRFGCWVAGRVARGMARRRNQIFRTLRGNIARVAPTRSESELDAMAEEALHHLGRTYLDMFRVRPQDLKRGRVPVRVDPEQWARTAAAMNDGQGAIVVGPHMSNFDLAAQWIIAQGFDIQVLSLASPDMGTRVINRLRRQMGMKVTPIDMDSLREALKRLRSGGLVLTGVDRPVSPEDEPVMFFGAPARLPSGHVRLAIQAHTHVIVARCRLAADGIYEIDIAPPLEMEHVGRRADDVRHNMRRILDILEGYIREAPEQWLMLVPVWRPEDAEALVETERLMPAAE